MSKSKAKKLEIVSQNVIDKGTKEFQKKVRLSTYKGVSQVIGQLLIDKLHVARYINDEQFNAADKFLTLFVLSGTADRLGAKVRALQDRIDKSDGGEDMRGGQEEYEMLYRQSLRAIRCKKEARVVEDVCCYDNPFITPARIQLLQSGLDDLIQFWSKRKTVFQKARKSFF